MNEQLIEYIARLLQEGKSAEQIATDLQAEGWTDEDIRVAFVALEENVEMVPTPPNNVADISPAPAVATEQEKTKFLVILIAALVFVVAGTVSALVFITGSNPFTSAPPYSEENLVSGIANSIARMETFSYSVNGELLMEDREADAVPFVLEITPEMEKKQERLNRDAERFADVRSIVFASRFLNEAVDSLSDLEVENGIIRDPLTRNIYWYQKIPNDYELTINFETDEALDTIKSGYGFDPNSTQINESTKRVTFSSDSQTSFWFNSSLPKPYFEELNDTMIYLPPELSFSAALEAKTDNSDELTDWQIALDIEGDFGDLIYRIAGDIMKIDADFYLRIRNMPSLFLGFFTIEKNSWIRFGSEWLKESNSFGGFGVPTYLIPSEEDEAEYREAQDELGQFAVEVVQLADELQVLTVTNKPTKQDKEGRELYPYQLVINKDKIVPFYEQLVLTAEKYETTEDWDLVRDDGMLDYLRSSEFQTVFDYYTRNTSLTLWVNDEGFIELIEYSLRGVPPAEATQLADKQARLILSFGFSDINQPVKIEPPSDYKNVEDVISEMESAFMGGNSQLNDSAQDASIKQSIGNARSQAELSYNESGFSYDAVCTNDTVIALMEAARDNRAESLDINTSSAGSLTSVTCADTIEGYGIEAPLNEPTATGNVQTWCVDSTGFAGLSSVGSIDASQGSEDILCN